MTWFVIAVLLVWVAVLAMRIGDLRREIKTLVSRLRGVGDELAALERKVGDLTRGPPPKPAKRPPATDATPEGERLVAPLSRQAAAAKAAPKLHAQEPPTPVASSARDPIPVPRSARAGPPPRDLMADWLAQNGLAWIGGAVLTLGGLFMVTYAAQRGFFTPEMRIAGAVAVGLVLLGAGEWLRRRAERAAGGHRLAAGAASGAGAATLYAAAWASHWLYAFIELPAAAGLLAAISFGLLGLAFLHGQPLALMAVGGALLAPALTVPPKWAAVALTVYLAVVLITGYAAAGVRRWGYLGMMTLAGAALWALAGYAVGGHTRVVTLALAPAALAMAAVEWRRSRRAAEAEAALDTFNLLPTAAAVAAALLMAPLWLSGLQGLSLTVAPLGMVVLLVLAAVAVRRRLISAFAQLASFAAAGAIVLPFILSVDRAPSLELWAAVVGLAAAATSVWTVLSARNETARLFACLGAPVALFIGLAVDGPYASAIPWSGPGAAALAMGVGAWLIARRSAAPRTDLALAIWIWSGAAALIAALVGASDPRTLPVVLGVASAAFAFAHARVGWRGFAAAAIAAALGSLAAVVNPDVLGPLFAGRLSPLVFGPTVALAVAVVYGGARLVREREPNAPAGDALATGALIIALAGAFVLLRLWASSGTGFVRLDPFTETGLRTVLILVAGLLSASTVREDSHPIGRWRGHALLGIGLLHAVVGQVLVLNPLWASWKPAVTGPPILDSLAIGFLGPALLLAAATRRKVTGERRLLAVYAAAAGGFATLWGAEELRRLFQGPTLRGGLDDIGRAEVAAYAVAALVGARALIWLADRAGKRAWTLSPIAEMVELAGRGAAFLATAFAFGVFAYAASPWWGPVDRPLDSQAGAALLLGLYAVGAMLLLWLVRLAQAQGDVLLERLTRIAAVATVFALLTLLIRWGFRGLDMRPNLTEASLETWAFSAAWAVYGFGLLVFAALRRESDLRWAGLAVLLGTTAKVFLFDMARLDGVVRAASFLAVGALLLGAAVVARRLAGDRQLADET